MSGRVSISKRTALALLDSYPGDWVGSGSTVGRAFEELRAALKPKRSVRLARSRKVAKKKTRREETAEIYAAVMKRADGKCELCGETWPLQMHHGFGRVRVPQAVSNCAGVCRWCHAALTNNEAGAVRCWEAMALLFGRLGFSDSISRSLKQLEYVKAKAKLSAGMKAASR